VSGACVDWQSLAVSGPDAKEASRSARVLMSEDGQVDMA